MPHTKPARPKRAFQSPPARRRIIRKGQPKNINRGSYQKAYQTEEQVYETRQTLSDLFGGPSAQAVAFTRNVTESLNVLLKGFLRPGDHALVSSMEHNAVMRPLRQLEAHGIRFTRVPCRPELWTRRLWRAACRKRPGQWS